jgi:hypothetical protein
VTIWLGPPYQGRCLFCHGTKGGLNDEHVISRGIRRKMPVTTGVQAVSALEPVGRPRNVLHIVLKNAVCKTTCNGGWMSGLEKSFVKTFGTQLSAPTPRRLDPSQQERTGRWAVKTGLLLALWTGVQNPPYYVPDDHLRWLPRHTMPPPGTRVWLGAVHNPGSRIAYQRSAALAMEMDEPPVAYFVTFSIGYLLFQVFGTEFIDRQRGGAHRELPTIDPPPSLREALTNIWPGNGQDAVWPPARTIETSALDEIAGWPGETMDQLPKPPHGASPPNESI